MKLTAMIPFNGALREALPVRSIPIVTDWKLSPIAIASTFVRDGEHDWRLKGMKTYSWNGHDYQEVPDQDWCHFAIATEGFSTSLPRNMSGTADWQAKSLSLLPAGVFVWLDEFAQAYPKDAREPIYIEGCETDTNVSLHWPVILPRGQVEVVFDGFQRDSQAEAIQANHTNDTRTRISQLAAEIQKAKTMALDACDHKAVWSALSEMALEEKGAFTGVTDPKKGLEYNAHNGNGEQTRKWFSKNALRNRMGRAKR